MFQNIKNLWFSISLKKKLGSFAAMVILVMALSVAFNIKVMNFSLGSFNVILNENSKCHDFQEAIELEIEAFRNFAKNRTPEAREEYILSCVRSERCLRLLPFDYGQIGKDRYARTWNVKNSYDNYKKFRDGIIEMNMQDEEYIPSLYQAYAMQEYLEVYAKRLVQVTLKYGNAVYQEKVPVFYNMPWLILWCAVAMMVVVLCLTKLLSNTLIMPLVNLAHSTRRIAKYDFSQQDITVENKDEMGELVGAFNIMKHSTEKYINTLNERNQMAELLYKEEVQRVEMEKRLDAARLELLKSQINPHFLFNTLNMIACMANLEEAGTTEKMISSLSTLFRYNLKTLEQIVPLEQELKAVQDYMYLQQMRFGSRLHYRCRVEADETTMMIPAFTLQPIVENAIIHGISKEEEGGAVYIRIWEKHNNLMIIIADTGKGMEEEQRSQLEQALREHKTGRLGIGLGNIYQRIHTLYKDGHMRIYSKKGHGTMIKMVIPQNQ